MNMSQLFINMTFDGGLRYICRPPGARPQKTVGAGYSRSAMCTLESYEIIFQRRPEPIISSSVFPISKPAAQIMQPQAQAAAGHNGRAKKRQMEYKC